MEISSIMKTPNQALGGIGLRFGFVGMFFGVGSCILILVLDSRAILRAPSRWEAMGCLSHRDNQTYHGKTYEPV